jgi:CRISPR-associated protein Csb2
MFAFEVEYLLGRSFAGDFRDRSEPEWPPEPGRFFSALASSYFENGKDPLDRAALEWLERAGPPSIWAGSPGEPVKTLAFVPTNYPGDKPPALRDKQPRVFPAQAPSEPRVYFVWRDAQVPETVIAALDKLASTTGYFGKACSLVRARVTDSPPEPNYFPHPQGEHVLRVPSAGRLQELERLFAADLRPSTGAQQRYSRLDQPHTEGPPIASEFGRMLIFRKTGGPGLPIEAAMTLSDAARKALMSRAGESGPIADLIHGHNGDTHCAIAALPFVGRKFADGHLMGFAVVLPRRVDIAQHRSVFAACAVLTRLQIAGIGDWLLEPVEWAARSSVVSEETWTSAQNPAAQWATVTPILLDRFPKKKGPTVEDILTQACIRIGLPAPQAIDHGPYSHLTGVPPVPAFRLHRKAEDRPRWGVHATIRFPAKVRGPVLLGAGRYFGLGLMRPERTDRNDDEH